MDQIVVIYDSLKKKHTLIIGSHLAKIELARTVARPELGYSKLLDCAIPMRIKKNLHLGATVKMDFEVSSQASGQQVINNDQYRLIDRLFKKGADSLEGYVETLVGQLRIRFLQASRDPLFTQLLTVMILPEISNIVNTDLARISSLLPNLEINASFSVNINDIVDNHLKENQRLLGEAWGKTVSVVLGSAYPPQVELQAMRDHYQNLTQLLPNPSAPSIAQIEEAKKVLKQIQTSNISAVRLLTG